MSSSVAKTIFFKELRDILRDRRTVFVMIVLPILLYPLLLIGFSQIMILQMSRLEEKSSRLVVVGRDSAGGIVDCLDTVRSLVIVEVKDWRQKIESGDLDAALEFTAGFSDSLSSWGGADVCVYYNNSKERSLEARNRLTQILEGCRDDIVTQRLVDISADTSILSPFRINLTSLATPQQDIGSVIGRFLGYLLIIMTLTGAFYPAIDLTAGEKERGTLETLLISPARRVDIVYGKFFAVVLIAVLTVVLNLLSMGLTAAFGLKMLGRETGMGLSLLTIEPLSLVYVLLLILPLAVLFSAGCLAIAVGARSFKEGQSLLTPAYMVVILPAMVSLLPGVEMTPGLALVPIVNVSLLIKEFMAGNYPWLETGLAFASTSVLAAATLAWAANQFRQETVLFRHSEGMRWSMFRVRREPRSSEYPSPSSILLLWLVEIILIYGFSFFTTDWEVVRTVVVSQVLVILLPPLILLRNGSFPVKKVLALKRPSLSSWPATLMLITGGWLIAIQLAALQNLVMPFPEDVMDSFAELFEQLNALPLIQAVIVIAVLPGICEEILCRGVLLRSIIPRFGVVGAVLLSGMAFGLLHLNLYRLLPTTFIGILLGFLAVSTGSIYPAMLAHALNNALSFLVQKNEAALEKIEWLNSDISILPWHIFLGGLVLCGIGAWWLLRIRRQNEDSNTLKGDLE